MNKTKIIFVSRAYPPIVGGIENQNYELSCWLGNIAEVTTIANTKGKKFLPWFLPFSLLKTLWLLPKNEVVVLGDGVLAIVGWTIKLFSQKPVISIVHGLDLTFSSKIYQKFWIKIFLKKIDCLIAVGNETVKVAKEKGIAAKKIVFIPNGVDSDKQLCDCTRKDLASMIGEENLNKKILLTSGRLAKRKGVAWFVEFVLPKLSEDFIYVVAGDGPDKENILQAIAKQKQEQRVFLLGYVSDENKKILLGTADLFIQPNIQIPGDMEGFGISVIEAGACRLPVLAANLEGLKDAIKDGKNGFLVTSEEPEAFLEKITQLFAKGSPRELFGEEVRNFVEQNYHWQHIAKLYLEQIEKTCLKKQQTKLN